MAVQLQLALSLIKADDIPLPIEGALLHDNGTLSRDVLGLDAIQIAPKGRDKDRRFCQILLSIPIKMIFYRVQSKNTQKLIDACLSGYWVSTP